MSKITLKDVAMIYPYQKVNGLFNRKAKQLFLENQMKMPYRTHEGVVVLQHFDLVINDGEFVVILGPSGSGKSTLLRLIAGLETPSVGDILFDGESIVDVKSEDRDVAMVFQNYSLYPNQTVYENISFPLKNLHMEAQDIDDRVKEISSLLALDGKLNKLPDELSGGEKQRVAIARALVRKPRVFLLDEPFSNLDVLLRNELRKEIKRIQKALKLTFVFVTHDQAEALYLADKLVVMDNGKIVQKGSVVDLYNNPVNEFVASFLGFAPMNIYDGFSINNKHELALFGKTYVFKNIKAQKVKVGIRPTNITLSSHGTSAIVLDNEIVGADRLVTIKCQDYQILVAEKVTNLNGDPYPIGSFVDFEIDEESIYLFDEVGNTL